MKKVLKIKVKPNSAKTCVGPKSKRVDIDLVVNLRSKTENGFANRELKSFLASLYQVEYENISILSGNKTRIKIIQIKST